MPESIVSLNADGSLALDLLDLPQGLAIQKFELPFAMTKGVLVTKAAPEARRAPAETDAPAARSGAAQARALTATTALCNDGALNLDRITIDLTKPSPLLSIPANHDLLRNVKLNTVLAQALGSMGFIIFNDVKTASGLLTMSSIQCDKLPVADLMAKKQQGTAVFGIAIADLHLDSFLISLIGGRIGLGSDGVHGSMPTSTVTLAGGQAQADLTIQAIRPEETPGAGAKAYPMKFNGVIDLTSLDLHNFKVELTREMVRGDLGKYATNGLVIPLKGKANKPELDLSALLKDNLANTVEGLFNGGNKQSDATNSPGQQPGQAPAKTDPLGGALDQLLGGNRNRNTAPAPQGQPQAPPRPNPTPQQVNPARTPPATQPARNPRRGGAATQPARGATR